MALMVPAVVFGQVDMSTLQNLLLPSADSSSTTTGEDINLESLYLFWSANTYTPINYEGRTLPIKGSTVSVYVDIKISGGNYQNLKYSWFLDGVFQEAKSGYARSAFSFGVRREKGASHLVLVKIFNEDRSFYIERSIEIPIAEPELLIYSSKGNSHFSNQASEVSIVLSNKEFSFVAKPYFFNIKKLTDLTFEWNLPGKDPIISSAYNASVLNLTVSNNSTTDESQENSLWVSAKNIKNPEQQVSQFLKLKIY